MTNEAARAFRWSSLATFEVTLAFLWVFNNSQWATNLLQFWIVYTLVMVLLCVAIRGAHRDCYERGRPVPDGLAVSKHSIMVILLAASGHFVFAALCLLTALLEAVIYSAPPKEKES